MLAWSLPQRSRAKLLATWSLPSAPALRPCSHGAGAPEGLASGGDGPPRRNRFFWWHEVPVRWAEHDAFGHVNNMHYYGWFDTAALAFLTSKAGFSPALACRPYVLRSSCRYYSSVTYRNSPLAVGLRVAHLGRSSVRTSLGVFSAQSGELAHATSEFLHVWVDAVTERPCPVPEAVRRAYMTVSEQSH